MSARRPSVNAIESPFQRHRSHCSTSEIQPCEVQDSPRRALEARSGQSSRTQSQEQAPNSRAEMQREPLRPDPQPFTMSSMPIPSMMPLMPMIPMAGAIDVRSLASASANSQISDDDRLARRSQRSLARGSATSSTARRSGFSTARGSATSTARNSGTLSRASQPDGLVRHQLAATTKTASTELERMQRLLPASSVQHMSSTEVDELRDSIERLQLEQAKMKTVREGLESVIGEAGGAEATELRQKSAAAEMGLRQIAMRAKEALRKKEADAAREGGRISSGGSGGTVSTTAGLQGSHSGGSGSAKSGSSGSGGSDKTKGLAGSSRR